MAKLKAEISMSSLIEAILDPLQVSDEALPKLTSALGTRDREDTVELIRADEQAAIVAAKIVKPLLAAAKKATVPTEVPLSTTEEEAEAPLGAAQRGTKARVKF